MSKKAVAKKESGAITAVPDYMKEYEGAGKENIERDDVIIPRLKLGQALSPEVQDGNAKTGDIIHNITGDVLCEAGKELTFIPVCTFKEYILWYDRNGPNEGGVANRAYREVQKDGTIRYRWMTPNTTFKDKLGDKVSVEYHCKEYIDEDGLNEWGTQIPGEEDSPPAATTHFNFIVVLPEHDWELAALSLSKTSVGPARKLISFLDRGNLPIFGRIYKGSTFIDQRGNNKFANWVFNSKYEIVGEEVFPEMAKLYENFKTKVITVDHTDAEGDLDADKGDGAF